MAVSIIWGIVIVRFINATKFLAGFWGITNDQIAVVTIERDSKENRGISTETITITNPSKSAWDLLQLLIVPIAIAGLGAWFQNSQREQAERFAHKQREQTERLAQEQREQDAAETREDALQLYFDRISELLIDKHLIAIAGEGKDATDTRKALLESSLDVIRARTLSILRRFANDTERKSSVIRFLAEAEVISKLRLNLKGACLDGTRLIEANLKQANLKGVNLEKAKLKWTKLTKADLTKANLTGANLTGVSLNGTCLQRASLVEVNFTGANLDRANLQKANLDGANLQRSALYEAKLEFASLSGANLQRAILCKANLTEAILDGANLQGANLQGANLQGASLQGANLQGANLSETYLEGVDLQGANIQGVNISGAYLKRIGYNDATIWPDASELARAVCIPDFLKQALELPPSSLQN